MKNTSFSHVALLVPSVDASSRFLNSLGIKTSDPENFDLEGTTEIYAGTYDTQRGLLLLVEATGDGPYKRALSKRGPTLHHIAIDVLNIEDFVGRAQHAGWSLHPVSARTMTHKEAWLFSEGVPTLIEVKQKAELSSKPLKVSSIELPLQKAQRALFEAIGLGDVVSCGEELCLCVDGQRLPFVKIACLESPR